MSRFLFVHPEGNVNNNPCLSGMVEILCERGHTVTILSPRRPDVPQRAPCPNAELQLVESANTNGPFFLDQLSEGAPTRRAHLRSAIGEPEVVVGVDRGIIEAAEIATACSAPLVLVSFEIFFEDEAGLAFKQEERDACAGVRLAICQDDVRAAHLSRENCIPRSIIRNVPVAGRGYRGGPKTRYWHERFGIPADERIALFMGSIAAWSHAPYVLESASRWRTGWHLVMHHRYVADPYVAGLVESYRRHPRIHFSTEPFDTIADMRPALLGADLGIAFYRPIPGALHEGHNLEAIGMASGKIAVYLQHGLPVAVNEIGEMSRHVRERSIGIVIDESRPWYPGVVAVASGAIPAFVAEILDLERSFVPTREMLEGLCADLAERRVSPPGHSRSVHAG